MAALTLHSIWFWTLALGVALVLAAPALTDDVSVQLDAGTGFAIKGYSGAERFRIDEATGNISRNGALFVQRRGSRTRRDLLSSSSCARSCSCA